MQGSIAKSSRKRNDEGRVKAMVEVSFMKANSSEVHCHCVRLDWRVDEYSKELS